MDYLDSKPTLSGFDPRAIPMQAQLISDLRWHFDYGLGAHEILLSGSYGSAKSILMAHIAATHCLMYPGSRICLARKALPDLKRTIFAEIVEHIATDLRDGIDYAVKETTAQIDFSNGSQIISTSWSDRKYKKVRSLKLSGVIIEELVENDDDDKEAFMELKARLQRLPGISENFLLAATNPSDPGHWAYGYFFESDSPTRHTYLSRTDANPFLPKTYIEQLKRDLDPKAARRYILGEWIELTKDVVYYAYDPSHNKRDAEYQVNEQYPIYWTHDFNIGDNKPQSSCFFQMIPVNDDHHCHVFSEIVCEGMRTLDACDEADSRGILDYKTTYHICGDASGKHRDTRSKRSDYDIIKKYLDNKKDFSYTMEVPKSNPPIRKRHNLVNAFCLNAAGTRRLHVWKGAPTVDKGLRLTALKKGGQYQEDDSKPYQHVTTALGYGLIAADKLQKRKPAGTIIL